MHRRIIKMEGKAKVVAAGLGDGIECRCSHLAETKSFWKNIHFERVVVWCDVNRMIIYFSKVFVLQFILFFKSSWE